MRAFLSFLLVFLFASAVLATDGDRFSGTKNSWTQGFILCDGAVDTSDRTCAEFDVHDLQAGSRWPVKYRVSFSVIDPVPAACSPTLTVNQFDVSGGFPDLAFSLPIGTNYGAETTFSSFRFIQAVLANTAGCTTTTVLIFFFMEG